MQQEFVGTMYSLDSPNSEERDSEPDIIDNRQDGMLY